ncbi:MAG TPA: flagellar biosynthesis anti-sigma factor FlgM [Gemmatirosa sp.]|jgi:hypothetical protein|nr:flagellar biosynthesis anti-sigma factor FlgM [Gemmatirosa sp.]
MSIRNLGSTPGASRPTGPTGPTGPRSTLSGGMPAVPAGPADRTGGPAAPPRRDSVQISDAARALGGGEGVADAARPPLTAERIAELRRRVAEGAYDALPVAEQVARRLRASGDV